MKGELTSSVFQKDKLVLPETATTRNGVVFSPREPRWAYRDGGATINLNFTSISSVSTDFLFNMKFAMLWYIENMSPTHSRNMFNQMRRLLKNIAKDKIVSEITDIDLINYINNLDESRKWYVGSLAGFIKKWYALGLPGITKDAVDFLNKIRLKGNKKGEAVLTMDPIIGPFTDIEREALSSALNSAYASGNVCTGDYVLCLLMSLLGQRPVQYSYLKICDVQAKQRADGSFAYILRIPRAKQRGLPPRHAFKERFLVPQVGELLVEYAKMVEARFVGLLQDTQQAPLFPDERGKTKYSNGLIYHQTADQIDNIISYTYAGLNVISERTGELIHVTSIRFRRTVGTQAAAEGHGELIIAELLDHSDIQNVGVYVAATPEIVERIDRAVAKQLAPLAQAFAGVLVDGKTEQDVPFGQRIVAPKFSRDFMPVGSCGQLDFCQFAAPIACYTCANFRAWLDGPHEEILDYLVAERERLMQVDKRIAAVNDRTILAVAQVVEMCKESETQRQFNV
jgi:hypothetical protein